jgi:hypothetical protein
MSLRDFEGACHHFEFFDVLRIVSLPPKFEIHAPQHRIVEDHSSKRWALHLPFKYLDAHANVKRILKIIADDIDNPPHSDQGIEMALERFGVEELDWRKKDLCPRTIRRIGENLRVLRLYWGGNNAVLRAWSEPEGLPKLRNLEQIQLVVTQVRP